MIIKFPTFTLTWCCDPISVASADFINSSFRNISYEWRLEQSTFWMRFCATIHYIKMLHEVWIFTVWIITTYLCNIVQLLLEHGNVLFEWQSGLIYWQRAAMFAAAWQLGICCLSWSRQSRTTVEGQTGVGRRIQVSGSLHTYMHTYIQCSL